MAGYQHELAPVFAAASPARYRPEPPEEFLVRLLTHSDNTFHKVVNINGGAAPGK